jgi:excisionase family DNA binding protein
MKITIEIPDAEVHRVLAPLLHQDVLPTVDGPGATLPRPAMMRIGDAANHLAMSRNSLYQLVARGEVPSVKIGRSIRIPTESLTTFIREESLRQKQDKEAASEQWMDWASRTREARTVVPKPATTPSRVKAQPKPPKKPIDLSPKPRPAEPNG